MSKKRAVIFTSLFEFGGSNTYLKLLDDFLLNYELHYVFDTDQERERFLNQFIFLGNFPHVIPDLLQIAKLDRVTVVKNPKQIITLFTSIFKVIGLLVRLRTTRLIVSSVEPEKYLYLLCIPFLQVRYVVHTIPMKTGRTFTSMLCNVFLSKHKRLVAVSRHCKADLVQLWRVSSTQSEYISVIHNTISNEGKFLQNQWRRENKRILTLGHAVGYKNPYLWTRVANSVTAIFPDFRFTWVGDGPLFDELVLLTAGNNRVEFVRASTEVWNYFSDTYLYYHPSSMESHGIAVLEAMASSIPCVVSNAGGLPESVVNEYNGFIVSVNEEVEHVNAIVSLINEPDKAAEFSSNSLKRYHENFSSEVWKSMMKQTFEFK